MSQSGIEIPTYGEPQLDLEKPKIKSVNTTIDDDVASYYPTRNASFAVTANGRKPSVLERIKIMLNIDSIDYSMVMSGDNYENRDSRTMMK